MSKYLRHLAGHHDAEVEQAIAAARAVHVLPMYGHYAVPFPAGGCGKLNLYFKRERPLKPPELQLEVACIERFFDLRAFAALPAAEQPLRVLDEVHGAVLVAADHFGWPPDRAREAYETVLAKELRFQFGWDRPKASPDRKHRVQVEVDFTETIRLEVVFTARDGSVRLRKLLSILGPGMGAVEFVLARIRWQSNTTVQIMHANGRDYWLCDLDGAVEFVYPRALSGEPQALYDLGRMYCEGQYVLPDAPAGRRLMEAAAQKGYQHAVNYLRRLEERGDASRKP